MCDTIFAPPGATAAGVALFAKNSDRQPNEAHLLIRVGAKRHPAGSRLNTTYLSIEQAPQTHAALLLKPSWTWGCEMGVNEYGLAIGNEAVFTRGKKATAPALLGMDLVRLALERCRSAKEAVESMTGWLEAYGQGGDCGYENPFYYDNSFLIADCDSGYILETAGRYWAAKRVEGVANISNRLSIGRDFDAAHPQLVAHALERGWAKSAEGFDFARAYSDFIYTRFGGALPRYECARRALAANEGALAPEHLRALLRSHTDIEGREFSRSTLNNICYHAGGLMVDSQTTGSFVVELDRRGILVWLTGASTPCVSAFKPWCFESAGAPVFEEGQEDESLAYWMRRERLHRMIRDGRVNLPEYLRERDRLELRWQERVRAADPADAAARVAIVQGAAREEETLVEETIAKAEGVRAAPRGSLKMRMYWRGKDKRLDEAAKPLWRPQSAPLSGRG